jgi:hypothetical protein
MFGRNTPPCHAVLAVQNKFRAEDVVKEIALLSQEGSVIAFFGDEARDGSALKYFRMHS